MRVVISIDFLGLHSALASITPSFKALWHQASRRHAFFHTWSMIVYQYLWEGLRARLLDRKLNGIKLYIKPYTTSRWLFKIWCCHFVAAATDLKYWHFPDSRDGHHDTHRLSHRRSTPKQNSAQNPITKQSQSTIRLYSALTNIQVLQTRYFVDCKIICSVQKCLTHRIRTFKGFVLHQLCTPLPWAGTVFHAALRSTFLALFRPNPFLSDLA